MASAVGVRHIWATGRGPGDLSAPGGCRRRSDSIGKKAPREYTALGHDLQESDLTHLERAAQVYDRLATGTKLGHDQNASMRRAGKLKSVEEIHKAVLVRGGFGSAFGGPS